MLLLVDQNNKTAKRVTGATLKQFLVTDGKGEDLGLSQLIEALQDSP